MEGKITVEGVARPFGKLPITEKVAIALGHVSAAVVWLEIACLIVIAALAPADFAGVVISGAAILFGLNLAVGWSASEKEKWIYDPSGHYIKA